LPEAALRHTCDANGGVAHFQRLDEALERRRLARVCPREVVAPVDPLFEEGAVVETFVQQDVREGQQQHRFGAGVGREPPVRHRRSVREAHVDGAELRAFELAVDDALRVRVEVVARLEVAREQQDELRVFVVGRRAVRAGPQRIAQARGAAAHVGVAVVAVDAPALQHAIHVAVVTRAADVVHDLGLAPFDECAPNLRRERVEHVVPAHALPLARAARTNALHRVEHAAGVLYLIERRRSLGAVAAARAGVERVALELLDREVLLVDVGHEPARGLAVEARRRHEHVALLLAPRPRLGVQELDMVPRLRSRKVLDRRDVHRCGVLAHDSGGSWAARM
jgi:uncharacterized protein YigA (DUF484 family)